MDAGRELDALVAERVFGLVRCLSHGHNAHFPGTYCYARPDSPDQGGECPAYSTDIASAWLVVEKMRERWWFSIDQEAGDPWTAAFYKGRDSYGDIAAHVEHGGTPSLAICLAALKACEALEPK